MTSKYKLLEPELLVIHCSATPITLDTTVEMITDWHRKRGFSTIGYHWFIKRDGTLHAGRPMTRWGAHASGHNHNSVGVCIEGGLDANMQPEENYTDVQMDMLRGCCSSLLINYPSIIDMCGHNQLPNVAKACPCFDVTAWEDSHSSLGQLLDSNYAKSKHVTQE